MRRFLIFAMLFQLLNQSQAQKGKSLFLEYPIVGSLKPVQYYSEMIIINQGDTKYFHLGNRSEGIGIGFRSVKNKREIFFSTPPYFETLTKGDNVKEDLLGPNKNFNLKYDWQLNTSYKFLIAKAVDSVGQFSIYSGYIWLTEIKKWKFLASAKINWPWRPNPNMLISYTKGKKENPAVEINNIWIQSMNGAWKNLKDDTISSAYPSINLNSHTDSLQQREKEITTIQKAIAAGKTDAKNNEQGIYYTMLKEGTGRQVSIDDTVVVHYKGYLFSDGTVFDQTKEKPASFPLKRLIRGWQIGVPLCKVGGKIKLVIPSDLAYSIRTRSAKIPPNSILVFEIEVVDAKPPL